MIKTMIYEVKKFIVINDEVANESDVKNALKYAKENKVCVELRWSGPGWKWYPSERYGYSVFIYPSSEFDKIMESLPKIYGV